MLEILTAIGIMSVVYYVFKYYKDKPFRIIEEMLDWWSSK